MRQFGCTALYVRYPGIVGWPGSCQRRYGTVRDRRDNAQPAGLGQPGDHRQQSERPLAHKIAIHGCLACSTPRHRTRFSAGTASRWRCDACFIHLLCRGEEAWWQPRPVRQRRHSRCGRTGSSQQCRRSSGKRIGRPPKMSEIQLSKVAVRIGRPGESLAKLAREHGVAPCTLSRALKRRGAMQIVGT